MKLIDTTKSNAAIESLIDIRDSLGWALITEYLDADTMEAAMGMGTKVAMEIDEIHFRRGSIHANAQLKLMPQKLIHYFENKSALERQPTETKKGK